MKNPPQVESLILRNAGLDAVPKELSMFTNLQKLDLSYNNILEFPVKANAGLREISFNNNYGLDVVNLIAFSTGADSLKILEVSNCGVRTIPENIAELRALQRLELDGNKLKSLPGAMEKLEQLESLNLSRNELKQIVYVTSSFWNLKEINVSGNDKINLEQLFMNLALLDKLEKITLSCGESEMSFPNEIGLLNVSEIVIRNTQIKKLNPAFAKNKSLQKLTFDNCGIYNEQQVVGLLKSMPSLEKLNFNYTECFQDIDELKQLKSLSIAHSQALPLEALQAMDQLKMLDLRLEKLAPTQKEQLKAGLPDTDCLFELHEFDKATATNTIDPVKELLPNEAVVSSAEPATLTYPNSKVEIPANAFLNQDGSLYTGDVTIQVKEMFDPVLMALEGAPMVYGSEEAPELFGSNGMIEFRAKDAGGKDLQPNPQAIIEVTIRDVQPEAPGQLFAFDTTANRWSVTGVPQRVRNPADSLVKAFTDSINRVSDLSLVNYIDIPAIINVKLKRKRNEASLLSFTYRGRSLLMKNEYKGSAYNLLYLNNDAQRVITRHQWKVDSLVGDETLKLFKSIEASQKKLDKKRSKYRFSYKDRPRYVKDLKVEPDFEKDHFVMSFRHKDSIIKIPVYLASGSSTKSLIAQHGRFFTQYLNKKKQDEKFMAKYTKKRAKKLKEYADLRRNQLITAYRIRVTPVQFRNASPEQLKFGLTSFGLVNCDYFDRNVPERYYAMFSVRDEHGNVIHVPAKVKVLLFTTNSYLQTNNFKIPYYSGNKTMILFEYGHDKLAVVSVTGPDRKTDYTIRTLDVKDQTPEQIHDQIFNL